MKIPELSGKTLLGLNLFFVAVSQLAGGGTWFHDSGAVHIVALLFIALTVARMMQKYRISDPFILKFVNAALVAMLFFAASHAVEFVTIVVLKLPPESTVVSIFAVYLASVLFFLLGVQYVLRRTGKQSSFYSWSLIVALTAIITGIVYVMVRPHAVYHSATAAGTAIALYGTALLLVVAYQVIGFRKIAGIIPVIKDMQRYLLLASLCIILSAFPAAYHQLWGHDAGVPAVQIVYLSHYAFYAAASALYLAFGTLNRAKGIYAEAAEEATLQKPL